MLKIKLTMDNLENCFETAIEQNSKYVCIAVKAEWSAKPEFIINPKENFLDKLTYYKKAYTHDLRLINNPNIQIIGFTHGLEFGQIEDDFNHLME